MYPNQNVRISEKGNAVLEDKNLANKISMTIGCNPEKVFNEGFEINGVVVKSVFNKSSNNV